MAKIYAQRKIKKVTLIQIIKQQKRKINKLLASNKKLQVSNKALKKEKQNNYKSNYRFCPKKIYIYYDQYIQKNKLKNIARKSYFDGNKFLNCLNKLGSSKITQKKARNKHVNKIMCNTIGTKITEAKFFNGVNKSINNINQTWPKNKINSLKKELEKVDYSNFDFDNPLSCLKIDTILDLLLNDPKNFKIANDDIKILGIKNCTEIPLINGIEFIDPKTKKKIIFDKNFIKSKITNNIGILNSYYKMIQKFSDIKQIKLSKLKKKIEKMIDDTKIFFCDMPINICGVTISNGNIYICGSYLQEALGKTEEYKNITKEEKLYYKFTGICKIYLTLLHEFSHKLHYLFRKENSTEDWKSNFYDHSEELNSEDELEFFNDLKGHTSIEKKRVYNNLHKNIKNDETGDFFDLELYLGTQLSEVNNRISEFFLCDKCEKYDDYKKKMRKLRKSNTSKNSPRSINSRFKIANKLPKCRFSIIRNSY